LVFQFSLAIYKHFTKPVLFIPPPTGFPPFDVQKVFILGNPLNCSSRELRSEAAA